MVIAFYGIMVHMGLINLLKDMIKINKYMDGMLTILNLQQIMIFLLMRN